MPNMQASRYNLSYSRVHASGIFFATILAVSVLQAGNSALPDNQQAQQDANTLARFVLQHEVDAQIHDQSLWTYHEFKVEYGKQKLFYVCQTKEGEIDRLVAVDGHPLDSKQVQAEDARIHNLISPREMRREQKKRREDGEQARNLLKMFPEAFQFQYDGTQGSLVKLKFAPNPKFHASRHAEQVFHHMEGVLLLDARQQRLAGINGELTSEVKFGGGLLGHLNRGGTFHVQQEEVSPGYWEMTKMQVQMTGKAVFFKTIAVKDDETYTDFKAVPDKTNLQQAAEMLKNAADIREESSN
jgi:hypothetical protein